MEMYRKSSNVEFDVIYDDGSRHHVKEGILFEAKEDNHTVFHIGTSRKSVFIAFFEAVEELLETIKKKGDKKDGRKDN